MDENIPENHDLIVVGTGLTESIVAAAASRIGKHVLHVDYRDFYGSSWATFSFNNIENVLKTPSQELTKNNPQEFAENIMLSLNSSCFQSVNEIWHCPEKVDEDNVAEEAPSERSVYQDPLTRLWTRCDLIEASRKFNFDLSPKILFSRGEMVEILISSGISRYAEFKNVSSIHSYDFSEKRLISVPCSRADVFNSKDISMVEKRLLMKVLNICSDFDINPEKYQDLKSKSFGEFLTTQKIEGRARKYIIDTVAMASETTDFCEAVKQVHKFVRSIGRFGNTPFLWTLYGSGELPQCFCRCSAVFGGIYCLKRRTQSIVVGSDGLAVGIMSENKQLNAPFIVIEDSLNPSEEVKSRISRVILVTNKPLVGDHVSLINFPSSSPEGHPVRIIELSSSAMACPKGLFVVHMMTPQITTAENDLKEAIDTLFPPGQDNPQILWSLYFTINEFGNEAGSLPSNVYSCVGPKVGLDCDYYVDQAKHIFQSMFPSEEFLPRLPDPEEAMFEEPTESSEEQAQVQ